MLPWRVTAELEPTVAVPVPEPLEVKYAKAVPAITSRPTATIAVLNRRVCNQSMGISYRGLGIRTAPKRWPGIRQKHLHGLNSGTRPPSAVLSSSSVMARACRTGRDRDLPDLLLYGRYRARTSDLLLVRQALSQ